MRTPLMLGLRPKTNGVGIRIIYQEEYLRRSLSNNSIVIFRDNERRIKLVSSIYPEFRDYGSDKVVFIRGTEKDRDNISIYYTDFRCGRNSVLEHFNMIIDIVCKFNSFSCYPPFTICFQDLNPIQNISITRSF